MTSGGTLDYGRLLANAGRFLWQRRFLWVLGVLVVLGNGLGRAGLRLLLRPADLLGSDLLPNLLLGEPSPALLLSLAGVALLLFLIFWLLALWGEGALIAAVAAYRRGQPLPAGAALRASRRLLLPFLVLDTLLFFPLFLLLLLAMLVATGLFVGLIWGVESGVPLESTLGGSVLGVALCLLPVLCLAVPLAIFTLFLRSLALRAVALEGLGARGAVRRVWGLLRRFPGSFLLLALLLAGAGYAVSLLLGLLLLPLQGLLVVPGALALLLGEPPAPDSWVGPLLLGVPVALVEIGVRAAVHAFTSTTWTLAYAELSSTAERTLPEALDPNDSPLLAEQPPTDHLPTDH